MPESIIKWMYAILLALLAVTAAGASAQEPMPVSFTAAPAQPAQATLPTVTTGFASWYGWQFHGRPTASGERYDMFARTAAHPTLPFDTLVRVSLLGGGGSVEVRINDRGPFVADRVIDLSLGAARELGMLRSGVARVRLQILHMPPPTRHLLQVGSFRIPDNAHELLHRLRVRDIPATLERLGDRIQVVTEPASEEELAEIERRLRDAGIGDWVRRTCVEPPPEAHPVGLGTRRPCPGGVI